jgi:hypothetical protein
VLLQVQPLLVVLVVLVVQAAAAGAVAVVLLLELKAQVPLVVLAAYWFTTRR